MIDEACAIRTRRVSSTCNQTNQEKDPMKLLSTFAALAFSVLVACGGESDSSEDASSTLKTKPCATVVNNSCEVQRTSASCLSALDGLSCAWLNRGKGMECINNGHSAPETPTAKIDIFSCESFSSKSSCIAGAVGCGWLNRGDGMECVDMAKAAPLSLPDVVRDDCGIKKSQSSCIAALPAGLCGWRDFGTQTKCVDLTKAAPPAAPCPVTKGPVAKDSCEIKQTLSSCLSALDGLSCAWLNRGKGMECINNGILSPEGLE